MRAALAGLPGFTTNFSQPIKDNVDEALAGVKGELAIKLYGPDIFVMDAKAREIVDVLRNVRGVADLDWDHLVRAAPAADRGGPRGRRAVRHQRAGHPGRHRGRHERSRGDRDLRG